MSHRVRFIAGFWVGALTAAFLNVLPYLRTRGAYQSDGFEIAGFPFTFRRFGGFQGVDEFHLAALFADITLGLAMAWLIGYACAKVRPKIQSREFTPL